MGPPASFPAVDPVVVSARVADLPGWRPARAAGDFDPPEVAALRPLGVPMSVAQLFAPAGAGRARRYRGYAIGFGAAACFDPRRPPPAGPAPAPARRPTPARWRAAARRRGRPPDGPRPPAGSRPGSTRSRGAVGRGRPRRLDRPLPQAEFGVALLFPTAALAEALSPALAPTSVPERDVELNDDGPTQVPKSPAKPSWAPMRGRASNWSSVRSSRGLAPRASVLIEPDRSPSLQSQAVKGLPGWIVSLLGGASVPPNGFLEVLRHTFTPHIHVGEPVLGVDVSLLCGASVPSNSFLEVLRYTFTPRIHAGEPVLGEGVSLFSSPPGSAGPRSMKPGRGVAAARH